MAKFSVEANLNETQMAVVIFGGSEYLSDRILNSASWRVANGLPAPCEELLLKRANSQNVADQMLTLVSMARLAERPRCAEYFCKSWAAIQFIGYMELKAARDILLTRIEADLKKGAWPQYELQLVTLIGDAQTLSRLSSLQANYPKLVELPEYVERLQARVRAGDQVQLFGEQELVLRRGYVNLGSYRFPRRQYTIAGCRLALAGVELDRKFLSWKILSKTLDYQIAVYYAARTHDGELVAPLLSLARTDESQLGIEALELMNNEQSVRGLESLLATTAENKEVAQSRVFDALVQIGDDDSLAFLRKMARMPDHPLAPQAGDAARSLEKRLKHERAE